jgi:hypothetical protein
MIRQGYIKKTPNKEEWCVFSHQTDHKFGCYPSKKKAEERLNQIRKFKYIKGENMNYFKRAYSRLQKEAERPPYSFYIIDDEVRGSIKINNSAGYDFRGDNEITLMDAGNIRYLTTIPKNVNLVQLAAKLKDIADKETTWGCKTSEEDILNGIRTYIDKNKELNI